MKIRFGGPTFPETFAGGRVKTWFYDLSRPLKDGTYAQTFAYYGEEHDVSIVMNWQSYIDRGMASVVEDDTGEERDAGALQPTTQTPV